MTNTKKLVRLVEELGRVVVLQCRRCDGTGYEALRAGVPFRPLTICSRCSALRDLLNEDPTQER